MAWCAKAYDGQGQKRLERDRKSHQLDRRATVCQSRSRIRPSKTILPSPQRDGSQEFLFRFKVTLSGSPDRVRSMVSAPDSPQPDRMIAVATAPVPQASVSASTPLSNVRYTKSPSGLRETKFTLAP